VKGREGESFRSPEEQRERIEAECEANGLKLLATTNEMDVSGATAFNDRDGLRMAVEAVENGQVEAIVAAYFDRFFRDLDVQREVVRRVNRAGGDVLAVGFGRVGEDTPEEWLNGTMQGMMSEYQRRQAKSRITKAQRQAIERGVVPYPYDCPGYVRVTDDRGKSPRFVPDPVAAPVVAEAFQLRADGAGIRQVRAFLQENGIERSFHGVQSLLRSRVVLGELRFGDLVNPNAHEPIVDEATWRKVQKMVLPRGRRAKSDHLLARLGVLRCGSCGALMQVGNTGGPYPIYRCSPTGDCTNRMAITASIAEQVVADRVRAALADVHGRASVETQVQDAENRVQSAQDTLSAAIKAFDGWTEPEAVAKLAELRAERDDAEAHLHQLGDTPPAVTIDGAADWETLTLEERRGLIKAIVKRAVINEGRGAGRVAVELYS
jgi:DNA invertase Pin-like site-specific DNA recombinase